ncbi:16S rRNA (guanine(527)-N(7))-methyltransferase RsmG [Halodesulfovibrio spirochaetisodalis]|uniref:Ribosomal RNA small subunit methyltransferase G n=1 Tax=Halodesulfovibrio spirochaetisodalis TaxID=1560234 RepID=A0A1B7X966_9BACT|nr:16S rRNA (guanine(527)-N(7))-methyltransferase RsmG [Halodesulfovibrio spirochaetisodalis]OBQ45896.1 glucose inhibited division protein [Halodesulfovibrio spirochaetisodalis]
MKKNDSPTVADVAELLKQEGFTPSESELEALTGYLTLVLKWNKVMNLVGPYSWRDILTILIIDSLHLNAFLRSLPLPEGLTTWDFGAGAGLPGIPLRALWQEGEYWLVDVREKRTMFMEQTVKRLKIPNTNVVNDRVENFMEQHEPADLMLSRAFMPWKKLLELVGPNIKQGGRIVVLALEGAPADLPAGWSIEKEISYTVGKDTRYFWSLVQA